MTRCLGGVLENLSGLLVLDGSGSAVADGWMDFIHGGADQPLFIFWKYLAIGSGANRREVRATGEIPDHVWDQLPEGTKALCAVEGRYDAAWTRDPKVVAWAQRARL